MLSIPRLDNVSITLEYTQTYQRKTLVNYSGLGPKIETLGVWCVVEDQRGKMQQAQTYNWATYKGKRDFCYCVFNYYLGACCFLFFLEEQLFLLF